MKKLLYIFVSLLLLSCSSDESKDDSKTPDDSNTNYVEYKGEKFYLDEATVERVDDYNSTSFVIRFKNTAYSHLLTLALSVNKSTSGPCPTCPIADIPATVYKLKTNGSFNLSLLRIRKDGYVSVMASSDLTEPFNPSNVTVIKNPNGTYSFSFNITGSLGAFDGEYVGEVKKTNY